MDGPAFKSPAMILQLFVFLSLFFFCKIIELHWKRKSARLTCTVALNVSCEASEQRVNLSEDRKTERKGAI